MFKRNEKGQALIEFNVGVLLIILPLSLLLGTWFYVQEKKTQCAILTFQKARGQLLRTQKRSDVSLQCGPVSERITLVPLEELDHDKGALGVDDLVEEVSQLSERLSQLWQSVSEPDSSSSLSELKI
jgi:hypothetical protein